MDAARRGPMLFFAGMVTVVVAGCSSSSSAPPAVTLDGGDDAGSTNTGAVFAVHPLGCGAAGTQSVAAVSGSKVAFASLAAKTDTSPCTTMNGVASVQMWDVCYAESASKGTFETHVVTSQPYLAPMGVGLALDASGQATVAYTGGGPAARRCGGTELFFATGGGASFTSQQIASGSQSGGLVPDQASNCVQQVCNSGDATGYWPSVAFDAAGNRTVAFQDIHFGIDLEDFASSDVEFAKASDYSMLTIDVARGGGTYMHLAFTSTGNAAVAHYAKDRGPALWINLQTSGGWTSHKIADGPIGEQLGFAIGKGDVFGLAYYDTTKQRLRYLESSDGVTWTSSSTAVDLDGSTGFYPSLAFDSAGDPAIAYYRCNATGPSQANCDAAHDGVYLARRKGGSWNVQTVHADASMLDGLYPALAFVGDKAVVAYQAKSFDPVSTQNTVTWWVAEEP
jgi:hypothetical protein